MIQRRSWPTVLCLLAACSSSLSPVSPPSFVRPERVAFACVRTTKAGEQLPVPLEQCSPCKGHTDAHALVAFVTQTTRGELAAVDLKTNRVIDTQTTVPGFTFVPVGESPTAVVVPTQAPEHTYVVHVGSSDLRVLDTASLLGTTGVLTATRAAIPLGMMVDGQWREAEPTDMVLSTDEQMLVIAAPRLHGVLVVQVADIARVLRGEIDPADVVQTLIPLTGLTAATTVTTASGSDRYSVTCEIPPAQPSQDVPPFEQAATTTEAEPVALALDADNNRVLVADAALPIIHAIDLATLTVLSEGGRPLFVTGVPTLDVAVSPAVPVSPDDVVSERYIYAIDAEQRDVLVINERGVMQSVNALGRARPDRLDLGGAAALSIEVIEPGYRGCARNRVEYGPRVLRGVFVAASMVDGTIRIVDVYDLDAVERCPAIVSDTAEACSLEAPCAAIQRHRPRISTVFTSPRPCLVPTLRDEKSASLVLRAGALDAEATVPNLSVLDGCAATHTAAYEQVTVTPAMGMTGDVEVTTVCADDVTPAGMGDPIEARAPLVCTSSDPWSASAEMWTAAWQGLVPGADGTAALSDDNNADDDVQWRLETDDFGFSFCAAGVEAGKYALQIAVIPADDALIDAYDDLSDVDCDAFVDVQADGLTPRLTFTITEARERSLSLGQIIERPNAFAMDSDADLIAKARHCVAGQRFVFGVRSLGRYTVVGARTGFVHQVDAVDGVCVAQAGAPSTAQAVAGERYENPHIAFEINHQREDDTLTPTQGFSLSFSPSTQTDYVRFNASNTGRGTVATIISELRYSPTDARLYAVDSAARGLMPIPLSPLPSGLSSSSVFQ